MVRQRYDLLPEDERAVTRPPVLPEMPELDALVSPPSAAALPVEPRRTAIL
jgi:hypothetical protein